MSHRRRHRILFGIAPALFFALFLSGCRPRHQARPNILFCIADDATWKHFGAYGTDWVKTPNFDRIAKNGLLFKRAYTPNAKCSPSRAAILTGRNPWQLEEAADHNGDFPSKFKTIAEALHENGYRVGYTGKGWAPGDPGMRNGKKRQLLVRGYNKQTVEKPLTTGISNNDYAANFGTFLADGQNQEPFFFWFGAYEPHRRYEYGSGIKKGKKSLDQIKSVFGFWPDVDSVRTDMLDYAFELEYFDRQLGKTLKQLEETGQLDNTLVVVTSDNGMPFPRVKGHNYEYSNHLPLAMMWKKGIEQPGRSIDDLVSFIDFAPTFAEVAGLDASRSGMLPMSGKSLAGLFAPGSWGREARHRGSVLLGRERNDVGRPNDVGYPIRALVTNRYLYIKNFEPDRWPSCNPETGYLDTDGSPTKTYILDQRRKKGITTFWQYNFGKRTGEELYDLTRDPDCLENLANEEAYADTKRELFAQMEKELMAQQDPRILGNGAIFDAYKPFRGANFYERYMRGEKVSHGWVEDSDFEQDFKETVSDTGQSLDE